MATNPSVPVNVIASGGIAVTQVALTAANAKVMTPTTAPGIAITLVSSGGLPVILITEDGNEYVP